MRNTTDAAEPQTVLLGHVSLGSARIYTLSTDDDLDTVIARLTVDR